MNNQTKFRTDYVRRHYIEPIRTGRGQAPVGRDIYYSSRRVAGPAPEMVQATSTVSAAVPVIFSKTVDSTAPAQRIQPPQEKKTLAEAPYWPLPVYVEPEKPKLVIRKKSWHSHVLKGMAVCASLMIMVGGAIGWRAYTTASQVLNGSGTVAALSSEKIEPSTLQGEGAGRVNILLLGVGGDGHAGGELTDTILLASVDPVNYKTSLLSVPRDLWVKPSGQANSTPTKINAIYHLGKKEFSKKGDQEAAKNAAIQAGLDSLDETIEQVLGVRVDYHVLADFTAFKKAIDIVGGVTVDVEKPLVDASMAWENHDDPTLAKAGLQVMDGDTALLYARSRHTSSDFDRSERQRQLLTALKQKALSINTLTNPLKLEGLLQSFGDNLYTDMSADAAIKLLGISKSIQDRDITSFDLVTAPNKLVTTDRIGNSSIVRPIAGIDIYSDIQKFIRAKLVDGYISKEAAPVVVLATDKGIAEPVFSSLTEQGYVVRAQISSGADSSGAKLIALDKGRAPYTRNYLEKRLGMKAATKLPAGVVVPDDARFVILVGK